LANNRSQTWYYPSPRDCLACHTSAAKYVLGVKTSQLNGVRSYPPNGVIDNQLRTWNHLGLLQPPLNESDLSNYPRLAAADDTSVTLQERVRSYLAANCAQCHRPGGVLANFDARSETPLPLQEIINGAVNKPLDIAGARVVSPAQTAQSIMYRRINRIDGSLRMPPLARNVIDPAAVALLAEWIDSLTPARRVAGLRGEYFDNMDLTGPVLIRTDATLDFNWGEGSPDPEMAIDTFSVRWTGEVEPRFSETYTFFTTSDDGVRLWINGQLIIDNWTNHGPTEDRGTVQLSAGQKHSVRMEFFENGGGALARLEWSSPRQQRERIPSNRLSSPALEPITSFPKPSIRVAGRDGNGQVRLVINGEAVGRYEVQASSDFNDWITLMTFANTNGVLPFIDSEAARSAHRFYRARGIRP
jgi:mono/diheme cytochrome c family protein